MGDVIKSICEVKNCGGKLNQVSLQTRNKFTGKREHKIGLICEKCSKLYYKE